MTTSKSSEPCAAAPTAESLPISGGLAESHGGRKLDGEQHVPNLGWNHVHGVVRLFHGKSLASMVGDSIA